MRYPYKFSFLIVWKRWKEEGADEEKAYTCRASFDPEISLSPSKISYFASEMRELDLTVITYNYRPREE